MSQIIEAHQSDAELIERPCRECVGTGDVEHIGGWARPCDACNGAGFQRFTATEAALIEQIEALSSQHGKAMEALKLALDWVEGYEPYDTRESKQKERDLKKIRAVLQSLSHKETMG